ncbi:MAG: acyl carrier protein [Hahellaceae bacterium]|jgi:acyl carrier protein|nr:acyl carrier protein [Hahellaceae bacterium]MCP5213136.1 acyl carrier protein [Hahellaceae bacterium]
MSTIDSVLAVLQETLQTDVAGWDENTALLGSIPEFDSMAVVTVITSLEDSLGVFVEDDEISAETFETVGSLVAFVDSKL